MAKKDKAGDGRVRVRVLATGNYGGADARVDDVIELDAAEAASLEQQSCVDSNSDAVAYAESLKSAG
jgi:hypothetical protein